MIINLGNSFSTLYIRIMPGGGAIIGGPLIGGWAGAPLVGAMAEGEGPPTPLTGPCKPINRSKINLYLF